MLRLCELHLRLLFANLLLCMTHRTVGPHLTRCQRLELLGLGLFHNVWVVLDVEEDAHQPLLVPPAKQPVFPRGLFRLVPPLDCNPTLHRLSHRPVVDCELCVAWLDAFTRVHLLELAASIVTKRVLGRHFCFYKSVNSHSWRGHYIKKLHSEYVK